MGSEFMLISLPILYLSLCFTSQHSKSDKVSLPTFAFSWLDDKDTFMAGDIATIKVKVLENFEADKYNYPFSPNISVNDKMGNSSYVTGVSLNFGGDLNNWRISFMPIMVGLLNVLITDDYFKVFDSSLHFQVIPGRMYPPGGSVSWMGNVNDFVAGTKATVLVLPKDAFGNNVSSSSEEPNNCNFNVSASYANGSSASILSVIKKGWNGFGYLSIEFIAASAGSLLLRVEEKNQSLVGSPLPFKVYPGTLDVSNCVAEWNIETKSFQLFSMMETFIHQRDKYGNLVPGIYSFDVEVMEKGTNLSTPIADLQFKEALPGILSFSFSLVEPGDFILVISDTNQNNLISNLPYEFTVYIGYCDGHDSIINGSGLNNSAAGEISTFSVFLKDAYQYPSPIELGRLQVQIVLEFDSLHVIPNIYPKDITEGSQSTGEQNYGALGPMEIVSVPPVGADNNVSSGNWKVKTSAFDVHYMPEKSGTYEIRVFCGNIPLNGGHPFRKEVSAGEVNTSTSGIVRFAPKVAKMINNEILLRLVDSYSNPVLSQESKLKLEIGSLNKSGFLTTKFVDNKDGTYTGCYLAKEIGTYEICASFDGKRFLPCPVGVNVYSGEYFPQARNDTVSVWEDESIAFNPLDNDYIAGGNTRLIEFQKPDHGSLLQYESIFRYTPYKGFYGNDSFTYTITDANDNSASGAVNISVLCIPPQFVSFPNQLQATEDVLSPKFGGFSGFEIMYSDFLENISITLGARYGTIFLSPMPMQFWLPMWSELSISKVDDRVKELTLFGRIEVINFALQSIQYLGEENFWGEDAIRVSTMNRNGKNDLDVPIFVEPINDPPFINIPESIFLENERKEEGSLIFDKQRDTFNFSIGDPDLRYFQGNESHFMVMFSVEVSSGFLSTNLPAELVGTTELKLKSSYQWQPLQTFVTISKHFTVIAKGIRFRGTVPACNSVIQELLYHGGEHGGVLTVTVNDMGWYGCYPDCAELMSVPLLAEATVNLIRRQPMSSLLAHSLGSAIVIEFIIVSSLGVLLLFFMCKCAIILIHERRRQEAQSPDIQLSRLQSSQKQTSSTDLSENVTHFTGCCQSPFLPSDHPNPNQLQQNSGTEKSGTDSRTSSQSSSADCQESPVSDLVPIDSRALTPTV